MINLKRVLYKVSGEVLMGKQEYGQDINVINEIASDIKKVKDLGKEICVVVGGGNIFRGIKSATLQMERVQGDYIGMLATIMNALTIQSAIEKIGIETRIMSSIQIPSMSEIYDRRKALRQLAKGRIMIFAGGTGNPLFTTDTGAILRAVEMNCDAVIKGTSVDGVYSDDPKKNPNAKRYQNISYDEVIKQNLRVVDLTATALARDSNLPIYVFSIKHSKTPLLNFFNEKEKFSVIGNLNDTKE